MHPPAAPPRILVADDQPDLIDALALLLKADGMAMEAVGSPDAALAAIATGAFDLVLMDLNYTTDTTSGREGIDLLARIQAVDRNLPVVVMTGWGSVDVAVEAMRHGVRDFVQKPWDNDALLDVLRKEVSLGRDRRLKADAEARELAEALRIQRKLLPTTVPDVEGFEIAASWQPASGVGGDCYDVIPFVRRRVALTVSDVVGKGIPAALLMSNLQAAVRAFATDVAEPADVCGRVNRILCGHLAEGRFISFFCAVADGVLGTLTYANAGHLPPVLVRREGAVERLDVGGPVLGVLSDGEYPQGRVPLAPGDRLVLFTDGITEARNTRDEEFGEERLITLVREHRRCRAAVLQARLLDAVASFAGRGLQDDATLIVMGVDD